MRKHGRRGKAEMEGAIYGLIAQFRHIDVKYDLMVREEIEQLYTKSNRMITMFEKQLEQLRTGVE